MNARFTVTFEGFAEKSAAALEKMLRDDIAGYPARVEMESASVEAVPKEPEPRPKRKYTRKAAVHAES